MRFWRIEATRDHAADDGRPGARLGGFTLSWLGSTRTLRLRLIVNDRDNW